MFLFELNDIVRKVDGKKEGIISKRFILNDLPLYCIEYGSGNHEWVHTEHLLLVAIEINAGFV